MFGQDVTIKQDSSLIVIGRNDSSQVIVRSDSIVVDSTNAQEKNVASDIEYAINYTAEDSMRFDVASSTMYLFGNAHVDYGPKKIDADMISINWETSLVTASFRTDTTGQKTGIPRFDDNGDIYNADTIMYNWDTERGYISGISTDQSEGHITGGRSLKTEDNVIYVYNGEYCPCDDPEAATYFRAKKIKIIPNDRVYTGPGMLYVENIPTPLVIPFGLFPASNSKSSGVLIPVPGNNPERGFFLRDLGYYWAVNDYIGAKFLGSYYSKGGGALGLELEYRKRYKFEGRTFFDYTKNVSNGDGFDREEINNYTIRWQHTPKSYTGGQLRANVEFSSTGYNSRNELELDRNLESSINSNIDYSAPIRNTPLRIQANLRHRQNNQTEIVNFDLPDFTLSSRRINPLKTDKPGKKTDWRKFYESVAFNYTGNIKNTITNEYNSQKKFGFDVANAREDTVLPFRDPNIGTIMNNMNYGMSHSIPVSAAIKAGAINISPSFNYRENWHSAEHSYRYSAADSAVVVDTVSSFGRTYDWTTGVSLNTRIYGIYSYKGERQKKLRHVIFPSVGFSYRPELNNNPNKYEFVQTDENGTSELISKYQGNVFSTLGGSEAASINFSIGNDFEMKYFALSDTSGKAKYLKLLENVHLNSSYNFLAEEFNLSNFSMGANTNVVKGIAVRWTGQLDPYSYQADSTNSRGEVIEQTRINDFAWNQGQGLGTITQNTFNITGSFSPSTFKKKSTTNKGTTEELEDIKRDPSKYVDFELPWSLRFGYNVTFTKNGLLEAQKKQSLTFGGEVNLSDYWKVTMDMAYDFESRKFVSPRMTIYRDLNCWEFNVFWVPFGSSQNYEFRINLKPAALKDLKLTRKRSIRDL